MLYYDCKDTGLVLEIKNNAVMDVIFLKHNGLCGQAKSSSLL